MTVLESKSRYDRMAEMRENGHTFEAIGRVFGISKQRVQQILRRGVNTESRSMNKNRPSSVYKNLETWALEHNCSWSELANRCGVHTELFYRNFVHGRTNNPGKQSIDKLLAITGLTYEQLFQRELRT